MFNSRISLIYNNNHHQASSSTSSDPHYDCHVIFVLNSILLSNYVDDGDINLHLIITFKMVIEA